MFSKGNSKDSKDTLESTPAPPQAAAPASAPVKRAPARGNGVPSILSAEVVVRGTIVSQGDIQVDGRIEGDIRAASVVVGEKAVIEGDVFAEDAAIRGNVRGSISAHRVQLAATCRVSGNILHETLSVESGAFFEGNCRHSDNPLADAPEASNATRQNSSDGKKAPAPRPADGADGQARTAANFAPLKP
jgi:cytoskeletal protein CcmA (bactofilin family)